LQYLIIAGLWPQVVSSIHSSSHRQKRAARGRTPSRRSAVWSKRGNHWSL